MKRTTIVGVLTTAGISIAACTGNIGDGGDGSGVGQAQGTLCAVDTPVRRLTTTEYNNTVRDLLGDTTQPASVFPAETTQGGFDNQGEAQSVTDTLAEQYMMVAEGISERATANMATLIPYCSEAADGADACATQFIDTFGRRAYRRPLTDEEKISLKALFDLAMADPDMGTFEVGIQLVLQAMLQSSAFLYRLEFGSGDPVELDVLKLNDWELASRLSYLIWNSAPDDELLDAAAAGQLRTKEQLDAQARRMLADTRAKDAIRNFHHQWLLLHELGSVTKDAGTYPNFNSSLPPLWQEEIERFVEYAILEDDGTLATLLTANYSFMNAELAAFYGIDSADAPTGSEFEKVSLDPTQRAGFLTMGALMSTHARPDASSPVHRGKFVREQLMCDILPPPPNDLVITPPALDPTKTTREQYEEIGAKPECAVCHDMMNPIGFGFENYDSVGLWRDQQNGKDIDATGEILKAYDPALEGTFDGAPGLAAKLAAADQVASCVSAQWFRFAYGRSLKKEDSCTISQLDEVFTASDYNIKELLVALTQTDAFLYRHKVVPGSEGGAQ